MNLEESQKSTIEQFNAQLADMENLKQENLNFQEELRKTKELYESFKADEIRQMAMVKTQLEKDLSDKNQEIVLLKTKFQEEIQKNEKEIFDLHAERKNVALLLQSLETENIKVKEHLENLEKQLNQYSSE